MLLIEVKNPQKMLFRYSVLCIHLIILSFTRSFYGHLLCSSSQHTWLSSVTCLELQHIQHHYTEIFCLYIIFEYIILVASRILTYIQKLNAVFLKLYTNFERFIPNKKVTCFHFVSVKQPAFNVLI